MRKARPPLSTRSRFITLLLVALIVALGVGIANRMRNSSLTMTNTGVLQAPVDLTSHPYTAQVPGPGCDKQGAMWLVANRRYDKSKGSFVDDLNTTATCQKDGLLISRDDLFDVLGTVFFKNPTGELLVSNYRVQITAQIVFGDSQAVVSLGVHGQDSTGADSIFVSSNGRWYIEMADNATGARKIILSSGTLTRLPAAFTIAAEVHGASIKTTINGIQVGMVRDANYSTTSFISIGVGDVGATSGPEARFSHFVFTPL